MSRLIAHRGLKKEGKKENTLEAFQEALNNDHYIGFECDVRTTKDKRFIINHGPFLGNDVISLSQYQDLSIEHHVVDLESVLKLESQKIFLLEIKEVNLDVDAFLKALEPFKNKNIYVMSFHNSVMKKLAQKTSLYKLGVLNYVFNSEEDYHDYDFICILSGIATDKLVDYFVQKNIEVFLYGIHHFETASMFSNCYLITDKVIA